MIRASTITALLLVVWFYMRGSLLCCPVLQNYLTFPQCIAAFVATSNTVHGISASYLNRIQISKSYCPCVQILCYIKYILASKENLELIICCFIIELFCWVS